MRSSPRAFLVLCLLAIAVPVAAGPRLAGVPARVRAAASLHITWSGLGPEVHEAELEFSLAGGRWVRISPELEAREGGFTWHVPAMLSGPARLRLRYGGEWFEAEGEVSTPFLIEGDAGTAINPVAERSFGEWWCVGGNTGRLPARQLAGGATFGRAIPTLAIAPGPHPSARLVPSTAGHSRPDEVRLALAEPPRERRVPRASYPLRI
jgi:hypothetical protein